MHLTLTPKFNIGLIAIGMIFIIVAVFLSTVPPWLFIALGVVLGLVGGLLQLRAMRYSSSALVQAQTAREVRRILASSRWGKAYLAVLWLTFLFLFMLAYFMYRSDFIYGWFSGIVMFAVARDSITLVAVFELQRRASTTA